MFIPVPSLPQFPSLRAREQIQAGSMVCWWFFSHLRFDTSITNWKSVLQHHGYLAPVGSTVPIRYDDFLPTGLCLCAILLIWNSAGLNSTGHQRFSCQVFIYISSQLFKYRLPKISFQRASLIPRLKQTSVKFIMHSLSLKKAPHIMVTKNTNDLAEEQVRGAAWSYVWNTRLRVPPAFSSFSDCSFRWWFHLNDIQPSLSQGEPQIHAVPGLCRGPHLRWQPYLGHHHLVPP